MSTILANASAPNRPATDFYPTPQNCTVALMRFLKLDQSIVVWEPACGDGEISKVVERFGHRVISTDLHDYGYGKSNTDFIKATKPDDGISWVITNPPFILSDEFILKLYGMQLCGFALLLKSQAWHSQKKYRLFTRNPPAFVLPLTWRPDFLFGARGGGGTMEVAWTVWVTGMNNTRYIPLPKPQLTFTR